MKVVDMINALSLEVFQLQGDFNAEVSGGYASDLLSDVMARSKEKNVWITLQTHLNIVAVAKLKDLAAVVFVNGRRPDEDTLQRAREENVVLLGTNETTFSICGKLYNLLRKE
jgi:hypothetical protein